MIEQLRQQTNQLLADRSAAQQQYRQERRDLKDTRTTVAALEEARELAQKVATTVQEKAHHQIADVVSRCLETVFEEPYEFRINFAQKRGRTEASLVFVRDGEEFNPMTAAGGGVIDVASFALRLSCLLLTQPPCRRFLVMDEPFKFLPPEYRPRLRLLIEKLAEELDVQFLIVTHIDELRIGKIITL